MKEQKVTLRAMAKKITWWQAAEIIGISDQPMRRTGSDVAHQGGRKALVLLSSC